MDPPGSKATRVAIIGGGFAGLTLLIGLQKYSHIEAVVYESAENFSELGAGAVLGPNAQRAMSLIDPRILEGFQRRATYSEDDPDEDGLHSWARVAKGQSPDVDAVVADFKHAVRGSTIHRAHFLDELTKLAPSGRTLFKKKLVQIREPANDKSKPTILYFRDGTSAETDIVIGADGIHSIVRKHILGADHPAADAFFTGIITYRTIIPFERAHATLGDELVKARFGLRCGHNGFVYGFPMAKKTLFFITVVTFDNHDHKLVRRNKWNVPVDTADLRRRFRDWDGYVQKLVGLVPSDSSTRGWSVWEMPPAPTYVQRRVAIVGDAAHASTPFAGAGAGQAIEDICVLHRILGTYLDPKRPARYPLSSAQIGEAALQSFDTVRRLRSQKSVINSAALGRLFSGSEDGVGMGKDEMRRRTEGRLQWIYDGDQEEQIKDACMLFERIEFTAAQNALM